MEHRQIEEWIFADQALSPDQKERLQVHLDACETCRSLALAWGDLEGKMHSADMAAPQAGFVQRFESRLDDQRLKAHRRQNISALGFSSLVAGLLFLALAVITVNSIESPANFIILSIDPIISTVSYLYAIPSFVKVLFQIAPTITLVTMWVSVTALAVMCLLWVISMHQFTYKRRVVR